MELLKEVDMGKMIPFDTLAYVKKLESSGITIQHAEAHAVALAEVLEDSYPTKRDMALTTHDLSQEMGDFRREVDVKLSEFRHDMDAKFASVDAEFAAVRSEIKSESAMLRAEFGTLKWSLIKWVLGIFFAQSMLILSVLKWPH